MYKLWFEDNKFNNAFLSSEVKLNIQKSFKDQGGGGWYVYPFSDKLHVIAINSIYWSSDSFEDFKSWYPKANWSDD